MLPPLVELRHGVRIGAERLLFEVAQVLLQVAHAVGGRIAEIAVDGAVHETQHAQAQLQILDFLAARSHGQQGMVRRFGVLGKEQVLRFEVGDAGLFERVVVLEDAHGARGVVAIDAVGGAGHAAQANQPPLQAQHGVAAIVPFERAAGGLEGVAVQVGLKRRIGHAVNGRRGRRLRLGGRRRLGRRRGFRRGIRRGVRIGRGRRLGRLGRLDGRKRVDHVLLKRADVLLQRLDGGLRVRAEVAVGVVVQVAQSDQRLLKPLRRRAVDAAGQLRIVGQRDGDLRDEQRLARPRLGALGALRVAAGVGDCLGHHVGQRFGIRGDALDRGARRAGQPFIDGLPIGVGEIRGCDQVKVDTQSGAVGADLLDGVGVGGLLRPLGQRVVVLDGRRLREKRFIHQRLYVRAPLFLDLHFRRRDGGDRGDQRDDKGQRE